MIISRIYILDREQAHDMLSVSIADQGLDVIRTYKEGVKFVYEVKGEFDEKFIKNYYWFMGVDKISDGTGELMEPVDGSELEAFIDLAEHTVSGLIDE